MKSVIDFADQQIFRGATTYTAIHVFSKKPNEKTVNYHSIKKLIDGEAQCSAINHGKCVGEVVSFEAIHPLSLDTWSFRNEIEESWCIKVAENKLSLLEVASEIFVGLQTSADNVFLFDNYDTVKKMTRVWSQILQEEVEIESSILKSVVRSGNIARYCAQPTVLVLFPYRIINNQAKIISKDNLKKLFPFAWQYLERNEKFLRKRDSGKFDNEEWYGLMRKNIEKWQGPKIMVPYMVNQLSAFFDNVGNFFFVNVTTGGFGIRSKKIDPWLLTAYLSSSVLDKWFKTQAGKFHGGYFGANKQYIENLPIKLPNNNQELKLTSKVISISKSLHNSNKMLQKKNLSERERERLEREIEAYEKQIDELVCQLYGVDEIPE